MQVLRWLSPTLIGLQLIPTGITLLNSCTKNQSKKEVSLVQKAPLTTKQVISSLQGSCQFPE
jgi:hypothetical protein